MKKQHRLRDSGGNTAGKIVSRKESEYWWCAHCGKRQLEHFNARTRRFRPKCRHCGWEIRLLHEFSEKKPRPRKCKVCKCILRETNLLPVCNPCFNAASINRREKYLGLP